MSDETPIIVEEKTDGVEQFKAQLVQSLELNDRLISEVEKKDREISVFKEIQTNMELLVTEKDNVISQLQTAIQDLQMSRFNEKRDFVMRKWITKFNLNTEQTTSVQKMLSKFTSEGELEDIERMLEVSGNKRSEPVALTQASNVLENNYVVIEQKPIETMSAGERIDMLWNKLEQLKGVRQ